MKGQRNCSLSAWFPSLEKGLERNGLENSYLILTWLEFTEFGVHWLYRTSRNFFLLGRRHCDCENFLLLFFYPTLG